MNNGPFPWVVTKEELEQVPTGAFVECADCLGDNRTLRDGDDPLRWARDHVAMLPHHNRFRVVTLKNFSIASVLTPTPDSAR